MMLGLPEISVSAAGYRDPKARSPREIIDAIGELAVRGIALDATAPGMRPRELGRSARRDLAASLRRHELELTGLDLWIPPEHFAHPVHAQRALEATTRALEMASELASLVGSRSRAVVSVVMAEETEQDMLRALGAAAQRVGATLADHRLRDDMGVLPAGVGVGVDPVFSLMDGGSPGMSVTAAGARLASARLSDANAMGRCAVGANGGKLDLRGYAGALIVSGLAWVTLDVRDLPDGARAAELGARAWREAGTI